MYVQWTESKCYAETEHSFTFPQIRSRPLTSLHTNVPTTAPPLRRCPWVRLVRPLITKMGLVVRWSCYCQCGCLGWTPAQKFIHMLRRPEHFQMCPHFLLSGCEIFNELKRWLRNTSVSRAIISFIDSRRPSSQR